MENASKALAIAGSVLMTVIVISAFIFAYREIASTKNVEINNERLQEISQFNQSYESYNDKIYGKQLISLAQKMDDYNNSIDSGDYNSKDITSKKGKNDYNYIVLEVKGNDGNKADSKPIAYYLAIHEFIDNNFGKGKTYSSIDEFFKLKDSVDILAASSYTNDNSTDYAKAEYTIKEIKGKNFTNYSSLKSEIYKIYSGNNMINSYKCNYEIYEKITKNHEYQCVADKVEYNKNTGRIEKMVFEVK